MRTRLGARLLAFAMLSAACADESFAPEVSREPLLATELVLTPGLDGGGSAPQAWGPAIGWLNNSFLVAWDDSRNGYDSVYTARVDTSLHSLDGRGRLLFQDLDRIDLPHMACASTSCLVVWNYGGYPYPNTYWQRIGPGGVPLDAQPHPLAGSKARVATDGTNFIVVTVEMDGLGYATRIAADGTVLDTTPLLLSGQAIVTADIAFAGDRYLLALLRTQGGVIDGVTLDFDGGVSPSFPVGHTMNTCYDANVAWSSGEGLFVLGCIPNVYEEAWGMRWNADAGLVDASPFFIHAEGDAGDLDVFGFGTLGTPQGFWVAWSYATGHGHAAGARISFDGTVIDAHELPFEANAPLGYDPTFALGPDGGAVVIWDEAADPFYGDRLPAKHLTWATGNVDIQPTVVPPDPTGPPDQSAPDLACGPSLCLATWMEIGTGLFAGRITRDGGTLDPQGIPLAPPDNMGQPHVVAVGDRFVVTWSARGAAYLAQIFPDGAVQHGIDTFDGGLYGADDVAPCYDGTTLWALWEPPLSSELDLYMVQLDAGLAVHHVGVAVPSTSAYAPVSGAALNGTQMLFAFDRAFVRIDSSGTVLDAMERPLTTNGIVKVSADPLGWLLFADDTQLSSARVFLDGGLVDFAPLGPELGSPYIQASFDGARHLVTDIGMAGPLTGKLSALWVTPDSDAGALNIVPTNGPAIVQASAALEPGRGLVVYARYDPIADSRRLFVMIVEDVDAGIPDAGAPDAGALDAGVADAGIADAGIADAGVPDSGTPDAGSPEIDGGTEPLRLAASCGCSEVSGPAALALALLARRRRSLTYR